MNIRSDSQGIEGETVQARKRSGTEPDPPDPPDPSDTLDTLPTA